MPGVAGPDGLADLHSFPVRAILGRALDAITRV
jgi:hypothetical protein